MFHGIAKLAREGERLELKARVEYRQLPARSLLSRCASRRMPFEWMINPYRGCEFGCKYCYARYTHEFMEYRDSAAFETLIFSKDVDIPKFARDLRLVKPGEWIAIGTATDPYQPAERRFRLTRRLLEVFARRRGFQLTITTKSDLIASDAGLLADVAANNSLRVNMTVTTTSSRLARLLEPMAPRPDLRLEAVRALTSRGVDAGVFASPVVPGITDHPASLEAVAQAASQAGARHFAAQPLFLKDCAQAVFLPFLDAEFPHLAGAYRRHYLQRSYTTSEYNQRISSIVSQLKDKFGLRSRHSPPPPEWGQMELFDETTPRAGLEHRLALRD
jgi:DNA repair photolyase